MRRSQGQPCDTVVASTALNLLAGCDDDPLVQRVLMPRSMRRALTRRGTRIAAGTALALLGSAVLWHPPAETCEREARAARPAPVVSKAVRPALLSLATQTDLPASALTEVVGDVVDASGQAVAGVLVVARPLSGGAGDPLLGGVLTDAHGHFRIVGLLPGRYSFVAIHGSYPFGSTVPLPVTDHLDVAITLDDLVART